MKANKIIDNIKEIDNNYIKREYCYYTLYETHSDIYMYRVFIGDNIRVQTGSIILSTYKEEVDYLQLGLSETKIVINKESDLLKKITIEKVRLKEY